MRMKHAARVKRAISHDTRNDTPPLVLLFTLLYIHGAAILIHMPTDCVEDAGIS